MNVLVITLKRKLLRVRRRAVRLIHVRLLIGVIGLAIVVDVFVIILRRTPPPVRHTLIRGYADLHVRLLIEVIGIVI